MKLHVEEWWKHSIEKKVISILEPTGLIPETPHDMRKIMENTQEHFVNLELNSEIAVSTGVAATAMQQGYSGIVNISPFACLIGRVIEGLFAPWARDRNYPTISVEVDGNQLPPNIINKLNIFMVNVAQIQGWSRSDQPDRAGRRNDGQSADPGAGWHNATGCASCGESTELDPCGSCTGCAGE